MQNPSLIYRMLRLLTNLNYDNRYQDTSILLDTYDVVQPFQVAQWMNINYTVGTPTTQYTFEVVSQVIQIIHLMWTQHTIPRHVMLMQTGLNPSDFSS